MSEVAHDDMCTIAPPSLLCELVFGVWLARPSVYYRPPLSLQAAWQGGGKEEAKGCPLPSSSPLLLGRLDTWRAEGQED
ncbi:hypothetical protein [Thermogemmatispora tikiterensis]|uniref:Uncharacterized protein n=1 Tax=Thermogemmatispora tikiterensis TaxID=1825093 RepID=A0A328VB78_9CHLR|nr:hypothetical protein [Thermogemmatispora tikiterensis]RAQ94029.1 hypothetical protein A4R35_00695 [Thermogemmatispora tikiterensis]